MSGSPLSPKFPTVALQRSKSFASVHGGGALRHGSCAFNIHSIYRPMILFYSKPFNSNQCLVYCYTYNQCLLYCYTYNQCLLYCYTYNQCLVYCYTSRGDTIVIEVSAYPPTNRTAMEIAIREVLDTATSDHKLGLIRCHNHYTDVARHNQGTEDGRRVLL